MAKLLNRKRLTKIRANWKKMSDFVPELLAHIDALEKQVSSGSVTASVGMLDVTVDAGKDGRLGTKDDEVKITRSRKTPARKKAVAKKKPAAKKKG